MAERKFKFHDGKLGAAITVQVTPRSSRNAISEILSDGTIRVSMVNAASGPRANAALVEFLAAVLEVDANAVEIVAGENGANKLVTINSLSSNMVHARIMRSLD